MLRVIAALCLGLLANAFGLLMANVILSGFSVNAVSFIWVVIVFSLIEVIAAPLMLKMSILHVPALAGGIALATTLVGLMLTTVFTDGLTIHGLSTWILATLIVWLCALLASLILPLFMFKKVRDQRKAAA